MVEVVDQDFRDVAAGVDFDVFDAVSLADVAEFRAELGDGVEVSLTDVVGLGEVLVGIFQAVEANHAVEFESDLVMVHDLKQDDFVLVKTATVAGRVPVLRGR